MLMYRSKLVIHIEAGNEYRAERAIGDLIREHEHDLADYGIKRIWVDSLPKELAKPYRPPKTMGVELRRRDDPEPIWIKGEEQCPECLKATLRAKGIREGGGVVCRSPNCDYWFCY